MMAVKETNQGKLSDDKMINNIYLYLFFLFNPVTQRINIFPSQQFFAFDHK